MTSRERIIRAIEFRGPDRVPVEHYVFPGAIRNYGDKLIKLLDEYRDDFNNNSIEANIKSAQEEPGVSSQEVTQYRDEWGILWHKLEGYTVGEVLEPALPTWDSWGDYQFPPPLSKENFQEFQKTVEHRHPEYYVLGSGGSLFQHTQHVRGTVNTFMDLIDERKEIYEFLDRLVDYNISNIKGYLIASVDGILVSDDWGTQIALLISPQMWRKVFKPRYKRLFDVVKDANKHVIFHSDGWILEILEDLAEIGVDVINPQHHIMGNRTVAKLIEDKMCLRSDLDRQYIIPRGTSEEIVEHVKEIIALFGNRNGGLILHGEIGPEVPFENIKAMYHAFRKYGQYPLI